MHTLDEKLTQAITHYNADRLHDAEVLCHEILAAQPDCGDALRLAGVLARRTGRAADAVRLLTTAVQLDPNNPVFQFELGSSLRLASDFTGALAHYQAAARLKPDFEEALVNVGGMLLDLEHLDEAQQTLQQLVSVNPGSLSGHYNLANAHLAMGHPELAIAEYENVINLESYNAKAHWNLGLARLALGDFEQGWPEYEWRAASGEVQLDKYKQPCWNGSSLSGKTILIHAEQGIGDEILFNSCVPDIIAQASQCILTCDLRLQPLFARSFPQAQVIGSRRRTDGAPLALSEPIDFQLSAGSLPLFLRRNLNDFPQRDRYLVADAARVDHWKQQLAMLGDGLKVGISWRTGGKPSEHRKRTTTLDLWEPLLQLAGIEWINLQYGDCVEEIEAVQARHGTTIHDFSEADPLIELDDFAAKMSALDLVISVGNATVHLAGALGVEAWAMLPRVPNWRWMLAGDRIPWYQSVRLYRQQTAGEWAPVFDQVSQQLASKLGVDNTRPTKPMDRGTKFSRVDPAHDLLHVDQIPQVLRDAFAMHQSGNLDSAEQGYRRILDCSPRHNEALHLLGTLANQTRRHEMATRLLRRAVAVEPEVAIVRYNLGNALLACGNASNAVEQYRKATALEPEFADAHLNLGTALLRDGNPRQAITAYEQALAIRPDYADARRSLEAARAALA